MQRKHGSCLAWTGLLLGLGSLFIAFYAGPALLRKMVTDNVILMDDSDALERWKVTPQPLNYLVYIFHVENPSEVALGARPVVTEKGPYVYDLMRERVDVQLHPEDDTVSYFDKTIYRFNKDKSGCRSEDDIVTILNAPVLGTGLMLKKIMEFALPIFNDALPEIFPSNSAGFMTVKVRELLFEGVFINCSFSFTQYPAGPVCQGMRSRAPVTFRRAGSDYYFSLFNHMNGTDRVNRVRVKRGQRDSSSLGRIMQFGNGSLLTKWRPNSPCNMINGTDTTIFKPFIKPPEKLPVFVSGSCRSMYVTYQYPTQVHGINGLHYVADPNMLASGRDYPPNRCFCPTPPPPEPAKKVRRTTPIATPTNSPAVSPEVSPAVSHGVSPAARAAPFTATPQEVGSTATRASPRAPTRATTEEEVTPENWGNVYEFEVRYAGRHRRDAGGDMTPDELDASTCLPKGSLDMSTCLGSPVILTLPHFYLGAPEFSDYAIGLKADRAKHETFLDIEPTTGIPMRGGKRVQLNMYLQKIQQIKVLSSVSEGLFPILWVDEGIELEGSSLDQLTTATRRMKLLQVSPWVLLGVGVLLAIIGAVVRAHTLGLFARMAAQRRARMEAGHGDHPPAGQPSGNYGFGLAYGLSKKTAGLAGSKGEGSPDLITVPLAKLHILQGLGMASTNGLVLAGGLPGQGGRSRVVVRTFCSDPMHPNAMLAPS